MEGRGACLPLRVPYFYMVHILNSTCTKFVSICIYNHTTIYSCTQNQDRILTNLRGYSISNGHGHLYLIN